jgi:DNA-binding transcriptional MocR family regulator
MTYSPPKPPERQRRGYDFVWDGRGHGGDEARYSILPGRAAGDLRLSQIHFRILAHLGRFNHKKGWCRLSQSDLAQQFDVRRQAVNKAVKELVEWGYLEKRGQITTRESFCFYRTVIDQPEGLLGVSDKPDTSSPQEVSAGSDTGVRPERSVVSPLRTQNNDRSLDHVDQTLSRKKTASSGRVEDQDGYNGRAA